MFDLNRAKDWVQWLVPIGIVACLLIIFVPLPPAVMDILLAANITIAIIILLTTVYAETPLELSIFPSLLLATTMFRLALNIATTRLILSRGALDGELAAGQVIHSFGSFVAGNQVAIGLVLFAIIVVVQFVVITKGATRISEVSARFALDGMPGKQMAIDAELNAGNITHEQANNQREQVTQHADFYGAMDGASKFVRGDAVAGVLITVINIIGGLFIGLSQGMSLGESVTTFTTLTIGDGLVSQLPALLISISAGLLLTRSTRRTDLPRETISQLFSRPEILAITAGFLTLLIFTKLPVIPLLAIATICGAVSYWLFQNQPEDQEANLPAPIEEAPKPAEQPISKLLETDTLEMELGIDLIPLADSRSGGTLLNQIGLVRQRIAKELGMIMPKVRVRDNLSLARNQFRVLLHGNQVACGELVLDCNLLLDCRKAPADATISTTSDFPFGPHAGWVEPTVVNSLNPTEVLRMTIHWVAKHFASDLLTRDATKMLVDELEKSSPALVAEVIPAQISLARLQHVLGALIFEGVSIRPLGQIVESLAELPNETDFRDQVERVRQKLSRHISHSLRNQHSRIACFGLAEELEYRISVGFEQVDDGYKVDLSPTVCDRLRKTVALAADNIQSSGRRPVLYVSSDVRPVVAWLVEDLLPELVVLGSKELSKDTDVDLIAEITVADVMDSSTSAAA